jgi:hypothetical protein
MSYGSDMLGVTEDTFQMIKAATAGIDTTTSVAGIDFLEDIMSWVPVDTPFFNSVPRGQGKGSTAVFWETLLNVNSAQNYKGVQRDFAAQVALIQNQYTYSPYAVVGQGGKVTWDAIAQGEGYTDVLSVDTLQTINQQLIALEINQLNSAAFALPAIGTVTLTASTSGGSIKAGTVYVKAAARSGMNWYTGGSAAASTEVSVATTGTTGSVSATVPHVKSAAGYDWFVGSATGGEKYYTTTPTNTVTITSVPTTTQKVPTGYAGLYGSFGQGSPITGPSTVPTTDSSYETYWQNGLVASILGDWPSSPDQVLVSGSTTGLVTPGTGVSQGAYYKSLTGAQLSVQGAAFAQVDDMNKAIYDTYQVTPSRMLMGSQVITDFANGFLDNPQAVTWLTPDGKDGKTEALMGGHVATYANKTVNGKPIPLWLMPYLPPGKIVAVIDSLPFPGSNVTSSLQARTLYDFFRFDYGANRQLATADGGPRYDFEIRTEQAFVNKSAAICGVVECIGSGIA